MENLQTDTLSDYKKTQNENDGKSDIELDINRENENVCPVGNLLNGCEEIDDPLDLMDHCDNDNESIGSNSDVWKGSDSEEESFENKNNPQENTNLPVQSENEPVDNDKPPTPRNDDTENECIEKEDKLDENASNEKEEKSDISEENKEGNEVDPIDQKEDEPLRDDLDKKSNEIDSQDQKEEGEAPHDEPMDNAPDKKVEEINPTDNEEKNDVPQEELDDPMHEVPETNPANDEGKENVAVNQKPLDENIEEKVTEEVKNPDNEEKDVATTSNEPETITVNGKESDPPGESTMEKDPLDITQCSRNNEENEDDDNQSEYNEDDDFDPSLLCPEVSMAVDENPVITNSGLPAPNDGTGSPLPYEPLFSTFVDDVTGAEISFNLTAEEQELRKRMYGPTNPIQMTKIHCTACNVHLGSALEGQSNRFVHPLLKVLICKDCYHFYTSGEFEKDEDGSELYCRWCGQGGQVLCCSKCEFVFCKRCIRTNFGRKKMFEIRDSDSWECFRCTPSQIITQRIACFEFFEYVRREISRASTLNIPEVWSKDHSRCCLPKKRALENGEEDIKKSKKRRGDVDPDYNPHVDKQPLIAPLGTVPAKFITNKEIALPKPVHLLPKVMPKPKDNDIEFVRHIPAPQVGVNPINKANCSGIGFRAILPSNMRTAVMPPPTLVRINSQIPPLVPTGSRILGSAPQGKPNNSPNMMKHEWFEKTVRAAARVNSHLSYTLTQLNKAQSQAASVEELAVVHNKLQEILSSSINSLIQIRKNLRTEFIAGIKTVRLPSKKIETFANDDDVIFVSAPSTLSLPSTSTPMMSDPIIIIDNPKPTTPVSTTPPENSEKPKGYLKVKSVSELQNVPSECITIPDDTPPPPPNVTEIKEPEATVPEITITKEIICNGVTTEDKVDTDIQADKPPSNESQQDKVEIKKSKVDKTDVEVVKEPKTKRKSDIRNNNKNVYNVKDTPSLDVKRMLSVTVKLPRVDLEELQKRLPNGCH